MASERASGGLGGRLREVRERRGITLRQIANATKISVRSLEALERNDISGLPGGIFSRAFVRAYAVEVGLDPEEMIQEFITQFPDDSVTAGQRAWAQIDDGEAYESNRRTAAAFARLIAVSVPIAAVVLYFSMGSRNTPDETSALQLARAPAAVAEPPVPAPPAERSSKGEAPKLPAAAPTPTVTDPAGAALAADRFTVGLLATGPCWVSAIVDGERIITREFRAGERETLEVSRSIVLTVGDASALGVTLNGADARSLGSPGQVVTVRMSPANFRNYLVAR